ncbi:MAG: hypothetical protein IT355_08075 [Gemmatimonadaceae bacterium]|nr:hypothetical protein [Gemmatimonadaceae bacterium]
MSKRADVIGVVCALVALAGTLLATGPLRGWLVLAPCVMMGVILLASRATPDRRVTTLMGLYVMLTGVSVGVPKVWLPAPQWVQVVVEASFWGSLVSMLGAAWFARAPFGAQRPGTG